MSLSKAAFLDRDGVINVDKGFVYKQEDFEFIDGVFEACRTLIGMGYKLIVVSNQSGIGRGIFKAEDFHTLNDWMLEEFKRENAEITEVYYCPYHPTEGKGEYCRDSEYRKPNPQMLIDAAEKYNLDLSASFIVGDKISDLKAGEAAGLERSFLVKGPHVSEAEASKYKVYNTLLEIVNTEF